MRQLTARNRRVANVRFPLASHLPCSFAAILAGLGIAPPPIAWTVTARAVRRPGPGCPRAQELASGPLPFLRLRSSNPRPHSPASLRATPRPDRPPPPLGSTGISASAPSRASPSPQLIGTSFCEVGRGVFLKPIGRPLPVFYSAPGRPGSASNRPLARRRPLKDARRRALLNVDWLGGRSPPAGWKRRGGWERGGAISFKGSPGVVGMFESGDV